MGLMTGEKLGEEGGGEHQSTNENALMDGSSDGRGKTASKNHSEQDLHDATQQGDSSHCPQLGEAELKAESEQQQLHAHLRQALHLHQLLPPHPTPTMELIPRQSLSSEHMWGTSISKKNSGADGDMAG